VRALKEAFLWFHSTFWLWVHVGVGEPVASNGKQHTRFHDCQGWEPTYVSSLLEVGNRHAFYTYTPPQACCRHAFDETECQKAELRNCNLTIHVFSIKRFNVSPKIVSSRNNDSPPWIVWFLIGEAKGGRIARTADQKWHCGNDHGRRDEVE
jgi:hypothetical protein